MIVPVILSGGSGTRLWPLSRELHPKQLLPLCGRQSLLQETLARLDGIPDLGAPLIVCNEDHRFMIAEQLRLAGLAPAAILLEPVGRNTAPAVAVAALQAGKGGEDPLLLVLPSDHTIRQPAVLRAAIETLRAAVEESGALGIFGVVPTGPETGYGYVRLRRGGEGADLSLRQVFPVAEFVEKPDRATARSYLSSGDYLWNSGMFLFRASSYLRALELHAPGMLAACRRSWELAAADFDFIRLDAATFADCPSDSVDYAVMEKTDHGVVLPLAAGWSDVGSWSSLWELGEKDEHGNVIAGDVLTLDARDCLLHSQGRLIAAVGVENLVVVETPDALLIAGRDRVQEVREVVARLKRDGRDEAVKHRLVFRPWGSYQTIDQSQRFQVKRIRVKPGASLSLQLHHHRAEHWVVVKGTARITKGDEVQTLSENQSTYIPLGVRHRLENPGKIDLELIEVQSGSYLGEDDIVRFDDRYGRE